MNINNPALPLLHLLGIPLVAMVEAEEQMILKSLEFIKTMGFGDDDVENIGNDLELGSLRYVSFLYHTQNSDGGTTLHRMEIPLLSLIPIPLFEIKKMDVEFGVKVVQAGIQKNSSENRGMFQPEEYAEIYGSIASTQSPSRDQAKHMKVKMLLEQSDLPAGISQILEQLKNNVILTDPNANIEDNT